MNKLFRKLSRWSTALRVARATEASVWFYRGPPFLFSRIRGHSVPPLGRDSTILLYGAPLPALNRLIQALTRLLPIVDQAVISATSFVFTIIAVAHTDIATFGDFSYRYTILLIGSNLIGCFIVLPMNTRSSYYLDRVNSFLSAAMYANHACRVQRQRALAALATHSTATYFRTRRNLQNPT